MFPYTDVPATGTAIKFSDVKWLDDSAAAFAQWQTQKRFHWFQPQQLHVNAQPQRPALVTKSFTTVRVRTLRRKWSDADDSYVFVIRPQSLHFMCWPILSIDLPPRGRSVRNTPALAVRRAQTSVAARGTRCWRFTCPFTGLLTVHPIWPSTLH